MRTTINIPPDALELARQRASERNVSLGEAIGELVRKGAEDDHEEITYPGRFRPFPKRPDEPMITLEHVNKLRDELP